MAQAAASDPSRSVWATPPSIPVAESRLPERAAGRRRGIVLVGVACVAVGLGAFFLASLLLGDDDGSTAATTTSTSAGPTSTSAPSTSGPPSTTTSSTVPPVVEAGWVAQLASIPVADGEARRDEVLTAIRASVPAATVIRSDDFASLRAGFWVVVEPGPFPSGQAALDFCDSVGRSDREECIGRFLSDDPGDSDLQCFRTDEGETTPACAS